MKELIDKQLSLLEDTFELSSRNDEDEENVEEGNIFVEEVKKKKKKMNNQLWNMLKMTL